MPNPPKPTALKVLNGSARKHSSRINRNEPKPPVGAVPPPWLPRRGVAWQTWQRLLPILEQMRVMTVADAEALAHGCMALRDYLATDGDDSSWRRREAAQKAYLAFLREFGMTPASRTRVSAVNAPPVDPLAEWEAK